MLRMMRANRQTLIYGMGDQHLGRCGQHAERALQSRCRACLNRRFHFRETLRKKSDVECKHKKQSGGHGQYGHVKMTF